MKWESLFTATGATRCSCSRRTPSASTTYLLRPAPEASARASAAAVANCRDNMQAALRAVDVTPPEQPELVHPHNLFQNSPVIDRKGHIEIREPVAKPGDYVVLHAMDKLVVVVTACSVVGVVNGGEPRELLMEAVRIDATTVS